MTRTASGALRGDGWSRRGAALGLLLTMAVIGGSTASAQTVPAGRLELGGGVIWIGSASVGSSDAAESTPSGGLSPIFKTSSTLNGAGGLRIHAGFRLTRSIDLEALASFSKPTLETAATGDIENAPNVTASETVKQYIIGGGVLWYVPVKSMSSRLRPFVGGHAAYLRQLHESDTLAVTGQSYEIGGGVKYFVPVQRRSRVKGYGVRGDAGVAARRNGVFFDTTTRFAPTVAGSIFIRF